MKTLVRCCVDKTVFEINPITTEALSCCTYDPWCYSDPRTDVIYMEYSEWSSPENCKKRWLIAMDS